MDWKPFAANLADQAAHPTSRWHTAVADTPRHLFVPRWWQDGGDGWNLRDGATDIETWRTTAYSNTTLVTRVGPLHADDAAPDAQHTQGRPTSSSTLPSLVVDMFRHARITNGMDVLDVGTGTGYGTALLCGSLGPEHVTSLDVDPYLVAAADSRLEAVGLKPTLKVADATGELSGDYDRIVATVSVRPVPPSWLTALRPGGRLVTTIADTRLILTADKLPDGRAFGRIERDWAGFMAARHGTDYPDGVHAPTAQQREGDGEHVAEGRYPIVIPAHAWELQSVLSVENPGIVDHHEIGAGGHTTVWLLHEDGSWARAEGVPGERPLVHQAGPRRLWDLLDELRTRWLSEGSFLVYGAAALIELDGTIRLRRGGWSADITAAEAKARTRPGA